MCKDVRNCVEIAKKGYETWSSLQPKIRSQQLLKLANASASIKIPNSSAADYWINFLCDWAHTCENMKSLVQDGKPAVRVIIEPVGVIALESNGEPNIFTLKLIVAALAIGNAVIIVNHSEQEQPFLYELCKAMSSSGMPAGVFNVFFNSNNSVSETLLTHREVQAYYASADLPSSTKVFWTRFKNIQNYCDSRDQILSLVTKHKCVWTNCGETFL